MRINTDSLIENAVDLSSSYEGSAIWLGHVLNYSIQIAFSGSPVGSFKIQASNDRGEDFRTKEFMPEKVVNWVDIDCSEQEVTEAGSHLWQVQNAGYRWARIVWTPTAGTGSLDYARYNVKGL